MLKNYAMMGVGRHPNGKVCNKDFNFVIKDMFLVCTR